MFVFDVVDVGVKTVACFLLRKLLAMSFFRYLVSVTAAAIVATAVVAFASSVNMFEERHLSMVVVAFRP